MPFGGAFLVDDLQRYTIGADQSELDSPFYGNSAGICLSNSPTCELECYSFCPYFQKATPPQPAPSPMNRRLISVSRDHLYLLYVIRSYTLLWHVLNVFGFDTLLIK